MGLFPMPFGRDGISFMKVISSENLQAHVSGLCKATGEFKHCVQRQMIFSESLHLLVHLF
jgi:hypothetical protein